MFFLGYCSGLYPFIKIIKSVILLLQIGVPIALILFGIIDISKAVTAGKEEDMKKSQSIFIKRIIYAVAFFLVITIVKLVMNMVATSGVKNLDGTDLDVNSWSTCWSCNSPEECNRIDALNGSGGSTYYSDKNETDESKGIECIYESWNKKFQCTIGDEDEDDNDNSSSNSPNCKNGQCLY